MEENRGRSEHLSPQGAGGGNARATANGWVSARSNPHEHLTDASPLVLHQDDRDLRTTSWSVEPSLHEYLLNAGWSSGLFCGGYEESLHGQTGSVFGFYLSAVP